MNKLYYQQDNGAVYIHLDGGLRHIPNPDTFSNLFDGFINPEAYHQFANAEAAPLPILTQWPIIDNALLVSTENPADGILLQDSYAWDKETIVVRHVINPNQMNAIGFDWNKVEETNNKINKGVPLTIESNTNINAVQNLKGYYSIYNYLIVGGELNPFFKYLLSQFPGYGSPGSNKNKKYKPQLKSLIAHYQNIVNNLSNS